MTTTIKINDSIEIIEDNSGGLTIQDTNTKEVCNFTHKDYSKESLQSLLEGGDMTGWELSNSDCYISGELYEEHCDTGGYKMWGVSDVIDFLGL